jgi:hypothetical protein
MRRYRLLGPATLVVAIAVIVLSLTDVTNPTRNMGIYLIWIVHALVVARAIAAGANTISREHVGKTWDVLVLTGIDAQRILMGKWLAVMHQVAPWMLGLGIVRLVMIPVFMLSLVNRFAWWTTRGSSTYNYGGLNDLPLVSWSPGASLLAVIMTVSLTLLEVMACTALGMASSAVTRKGWSAIVVAFCLRFAPVVIFTAFTQYEVGDRPAWRVLTFTPLSLADSGTSTLYQLSLPITSRTIFMQNNALVGLSLATILLIIFLAVSLWAANRAILRSGALSIQESRA